MPAKRSTISPSKVSPAKAVAKPATKAAKPVAKAAKAAVAKPAAKPAKAKAVAKATKAPLSPNSCSAALVKAEQKIKRLNRAAKRAVAGTKPKAAPVFREKGNYISFYTRMYPVIKGEYPDYAVTDVSREAGARWRSLSDSERRAYQAPGV